MSYHYLFHYDLNQLASIRLLAADYLEGVLDSCI